MMLSPNNLLHRLLGIDIIKVFSLNAIATFIRMIAGMISVKVVAVIIGPAGIALLGQLKNIETILLGLANGGISNGITKYIAEYKEDELLTRAYISNAFRITIIATSIVALILIIGCYQLSNLILFSEEYFYVFIVFGFTILMYTLNTLLISILNGYKQFKKYAIVNICGTLFGLIYSVVLVFLWELPGAMINAVTYQSVIFLVTLWMCRKMPWMKKVFFLEKMNYPIVKKYLGFSIMTLVTLALAPTVRIILRSYIITEVSATDAGIWEGMNSIASMYLSVITTAFSIYYLPRLSEIKDSGELHKEIFRCYKVFVPMLLGMTMVIFLLRNFVIQLLFTKEFEPMEGLFIWQLAGDFFKICSWMLAYIMVAKAMTKTFITTEIVFGILYLILSFFFMRINGIVGLVQGYFINYFIYMVAMIIMFRNILIVRRS